MADLQLLQEIFQVMLSPMENSQLTSTLRPLLSNLFELSSPLANNAQEIFKHHWREDTIYAAITSQDKMNFNVKLGNLLGPFFFSSCFWVGISLVSDSFA